jgi:hypothetical protein
MAPRDGTLVFCSGQDFYTDKVPVLQAAPVAPCPLVFRRVVAIWTGVSAVVGPGVSICLRNSLSQVRGPCSGRQLPEQDRVALL